MLEQNLEGQAHREYVAREIVSNTAVRLSGVALSKLVLLVTTALLARYLGSENFGKYAFVLSYLTFFQILIDPGIAPLLLQKLHDLPQGATGALLGNVLLLKLLLSGMAIALSIGLMLCLGYAPDIQQAAIIGALGLLAGRSDVYAVLFQARLEQKYITYAELLEQLVTSGLIVLVIAFDQGFLAVIVAVVAGNAFRFLASWFFSRRLTRTQFQVDLSLWGELLRGGLPIALGTALGTALANLDLLTVQGMMGNEAAGFYGAAKRLVSPWSLIPGVYVSVVYPVFYQLFRGGKTTHFVRAYELSFKYMLVVVLPVAMGITLTAESIVRLVYGQQFLKSAAALAIIVWSQVFLFVKLVNDYLLITTGRQRLSAQLTGVSAVVNAILNVLLCRRYGYEGAAISAVASYALFLPLQCAFPDARKYSLAIIRQAIKPLVAAALMALFVALVLQFRLAQSLMLGPLVYAGALASLKAIRRADIELLSGGRWFRSHRGGEAAK